jgi:hypothetical protein
MVADLAGIEKGKTMRQGKADQSVTVSATGDVVVGDNVTFDEAVFAGSHRKPKFVGLRTISATVVKDSYGAGKQQHTFTLLVTGSTGVDPLKVGEKALRKARNVYRNGVSRQLWDDESARLEAQAEKHERGGAAREVRAVRRETEEPRASSFL